ncbi:MAG: mercury(II) reductase [Dehalococcoidia bacterium]
MKMDRYDLIIIGGGAGGFAAATRASELGAKVVIINSGLPIGGTCVNVGCVPSKVLLEIGSEYYNPQHPRFRAIRNGRPAIFDFAAAIREKDEMVAALRASNYIKVAEGLAGLTVIEGRARFLSPHRVEVNGQTLEAEKFVIATGSRSKILPFPGIDKVHYLTNREALSLPRLPQSMVVIGAGPIGLEFAQMYARFGTQVTVLEKEGQILPLSEPEVADELQRCLEEEGIVINTGVDVERVAEERGVKRVEATYEGQHLMFEGAELLLATGVTPNTEDMGLERAGVAVDGRGFITVSPELQTSTPHIWAAGDVVGKMFLETVAAKEGYLAAGNALEGTRKSIDYDSVPRAVFTDPQVASVGITETELMQRINSCSCRTVEIAQVPKAQAIKETRGLVKMIAHPETGIVVGVHMVAPMAADLIHEATLAVKFKLTVDDIIDTVHVFPTLSEAIKRVAQSFRRDISKMSCCVD